MNRSKVRIGLIVAICLGAVSVQLPAAEPATAPANRSALHKLSVEEFDAARKIDGAIVLDVRSPEEFAAGHVPGAINVPVTGKGSEAFDKKIADLPKDKPILVHCRSGPRATKACAQMAGKGFANLSLFPGGWVAWSEAGKPVVKGADK